MKSFIFFSLVGLFSNYFLWCGPASRLSEKMRQEIFLKWNAEWEAEKNKASSYFLELHEEGKITTFSVTSDETSGEEWIARFQKKGIDIDDKTKSLLLSSFFQPTSGITTEIAVLQESLFEEDNRTNRNICKLADDCGLGNLSLEAACLIRDKFIDEEEMTLATGVRWITIMNNPIEVTRESSPIRFIDLSGNSYSDFEVFGVDPNETLPTLFIVFGWGKNQTIGLLPGNGEEDERWWDGGRGFAFAVLN